MYVYANLQGKWCIIYFIFYNTKQFVTKSPYYYKIRNYFSSKGLQTEIVKKKKNNYNTMNRTSNENLTLAVIYIAIFYAIGLTNMNCTYK